LAAGDLEEWEPTAAPTAAEALQENEDSVSAASSLLSSHLSDRQLTAKQALAQLKLYQLK